MQRAKHETDLDFAASQVKRYVETGQVEAVDGSLIPLDAESICVHGDGPNGVEVVEAVGAALKGLGRKVEAVVA